MFGGGVNSGGTAGLLRCGKGTTWEGKCGAVRPERLRAPFDSPRPPALNLSATGGVREPAIFYWPGMLPAAQRRTQVAQTMDLFVTILEV